MIIKGAETEINLVGLFLANSYKPPYPNLDLWLERRINQDIENCLAWSPPKISNKGRLLFVKRVCVHPPLGEPYWSMTMVCDNGDGGKVIVPWPGKAVKSLKELDVPMWLWESLCDLNSLSIDEKELM